MTVENIVTANHFADRNTKIKVKFEKLIKTRDYESERMDAEMEFELRPGENAVVETIRAEAAIEYSVLEALLFKRQIDQSFFNARVNQLDEAVAAIEHKTGVAPTA